jgi:hypothetical protein
MYVCFYEACTSVFMKHVIVGSEIVMLVILIKDFFKKYLCQIFFNLIIIFSNLGCEQGTISRFFPHPCLERCQGGN